MGTQRTNRTRITSRLKIRPQYGTVLALIALAYGLCATQNASTSNTGTLLLQLVTVGIIFHVAQIGRVLRRITYGVLAIAAALVTVTSIVGAKGQLLDVALCLAAMAMYCVSPGVIIYQQFRRSRIDVQTLLSAISAYLLFGMFFTFVFNLNGLFVPSGLFGQASTNTLSTQLFFSFSSLTTTGYGNVVPVEPFGQSTAIAEAIIGQLFLIVAVARIVTVMVPPRERA